jgi:V-type H+-transporting ATPase subunit a
MMLMSYPTSPKSSQTFYSIQRPIQTALLVTAVLCIPWMLLGKPIYIIMKNRKKKNVSFHFIYLF